MRTLVVDDSALFREALVNLLEQETNCQIVGVAADGWEAFQLARAEQPDLILMDLNMPVWDGLKATQHIKAEMPHSHILLVTAAPDESAWELAVRYGAEGCVDKDRTEILVAVKRLTRQRGGCMTYNMPAL